VIEVLLHPRAGAAAAAEAEPHGQLRKGGERTNPPPPVVAGDHEEERERRDGDGPENPSRQPRNEHAEDDHAWKDAERRAAEDVHPRRIGRR
jgi:hypothetical protein